MMGTDGVDLVLRRLLHAGCNPEPMGNRAWIARCPVHGGPYLALVVCRGGNGSVFVKCRYTNSGGNSCSEAEIWESLGLEAQPFERAVPATARVEIADEADAEPSPAVCDPRLEAVEPASLQAMEIESPVAERDDNDDGPDRLNDAAEAPSTLELAAFAAQNGAPDHEAWAEGAEARPDLVAAADMAEDGRLPDQSAVADDVGPPGGIMHQPAVADDVGPAVILTHEDAAERSARAAVGAPPEIAAGEAVTADGLPETTIAVGVPARSRRARSAGGARSGSGGEAGSHARMLRTLARQVRIVRGLDHRLFAEIPVDGHHEFHALRSEAFESWLIMNYVQRQRPVPTGGRLKTLIRAFEADAALRCPTETVWVRVADGTGRSGTGGPLQSHGRLNAPVRSVADAPPAYYLDLGDSSWRSVEIRAEGCRVVDRAPVMFRRPKGFGELPEPEWDGSMDLLRKYANIADADFPLLVAWLTAALRPTGPYPILILNGEQGSAKTTLARVVRRLIDPNSAPLRGLPMSQRDFMIQAHNSWILAYDNIRSVSKSLSDVCCRAATGGGFSTRSLRSNDDETLFDIERPVIFNGIDDFARSSDLIDRCVFLHMPAIPDRARLRERAYWSEFDADCPRLLGALLMAVAGGLKLLPRIDLEASPRMADFADWGEAVIRGLGGEPGSFLRRYNDNRRVACESALEDCPVAEALRRAVESRTSPLQLTASDLLRTLAGYMPQSVMRMAQWPKTPRALSCALRRILPQLRMVGIGVTFERIDNTRMITLSPQQGDSGAGSAA